MQNELPDLFQFEDGQRVQNGAEWNRRRVELRDLVVGLEYGGLPPTPAEVSGELLHRYNRTDGATHVQYRLICAPDGTFQFVLKLWIPVGDGPFPVVLTGDACWCYRTDEVTEEVLRRGYILAEFNRVEIAHDNYHSTRDSGIYVIYPDGDYGALAAWAWGYHRCVDFLTTLDVVNNERIAITGHSRGGKAVLLAGATDERIAITNPNNSGCGGAGCYRWQGPGSETLADILKAVPYWFGPQLKEFINRETALPFDQHSLKALVAPRALLMTEALGDLWANPQGTWQTHVAAREVYRWLDAEQRLGIWFREGEHDHGFMDWVTFLDFADWQLRGIESARRFDINPFPDLPRAFAWTAPGTGS